jgi:hypothetical protein
MAQQLSIIKSLAEFSSIKSRWLPCSNPKNILEGMSCFFTGYMPSQATGNLETILIIYGFWLYAFAIPLMMIFSLFDNFIKHSGVIQNETYRNIISMGFTFLVYRSFLITKLIDYLYIGTLGVIILILNFIAISYVLKTTNKLFRRIKVQNEKELKSKSIQELKTFAKKSLSKLKTIPSVELMSVFFEDTIRDSLKTVFESENKMNVFEKLVSDFEVARYRRSRENMINVIDQMIEEIQ